MGALGAAVAVSVMAGCGGMDRTSMGPSQPMAASAMPSGRHTMPDGTVMGGSDMPGETRTSGGDSPAVEGQPSAVASMICGDEIAGVVQRTLTLKSPPDRTALWSDPIYRCDYVLPGGHLTLTVADLSTAGPGRAWFDTLRKRLPPSSTIKGMSNFGFPAYESASGDVVFLKDDKTLWVDASSVPTSDLPRTYNRAEAAYQVASAVIACWSE